MADETDQSQKTEEPTQRKLEQAREKGQVPSSKEVGHWAILFAGALALMFLFPAMGRDLLNLGLPFIEKPHAMATDIDTLDYILTSVVVDMAAAFGLFAFFVVFAALISNLIQNGVLYSIEPMKPKLEKISPLKGFKRLFSLKSLVEFLKGLLKLVIVGALLGAIFYPMLDDMPQLVYASAIDLLARAQEAAFYLFIGVLSILFVITVADFIYQRFEYMKSQRMSRQEIKDEFKQTEGDPHVKGKLRQIRMERAKKRMLSAVPDASVVITNPTHFAVALKYEQGQVGAPVVLAKGIDHLALKIREVAEENKIPIVENPPLARALYASVEIDEEIPFEHFKAVAKVISYILGLNKKKS